VLGPTLAQLGEGGAPEAVIPLTRPLSQIDPSVRAMAAMLRGQGPVPSSSVSTTVGATSNQTNNFTINDMTGDGEATAQKVMNRIAVGL